MLQLHHDSPTSPTLTNYSTPDTHTPLRRPSAFTNLARNEVPFSRPKLRDHCLACMSQREGKIHEINVKGKMNSWEKGTTSSIAKQREKWTNVKGKSPPKVFMRNETPYAARSSGYSRSAGSFSSAAGVLWKPAYKIDDRKVEYLKVCLINGFIISKVGSRAVNKPLAVKNNSPIIGPRVVRRASEPTRSSVPIVIKRRRKEPEVEEVHVHTCSEDGIVEDLKAIDETKTRFNSNDAGISLNLNTCKVLSQEGIADLKGLGIIETIPEMDDSDQDIIPVESIDNVSIISSHILHAYPEPSSLSEPAEDSPSIEDQDNIPVETIDDISSIASHNIDPHEPSSSTIVYEAVENRLESPIESKIVHETASSRNNQEEPLNQSHQDLGMALLLFTSRSIIPNYRAISISAKSS
jgi:hypothetical protein